MCLYFCSGLKPPYPHLNGTVLFTRLVYVVLSVVLSPPWFLSIALFHFQANGWLPRIPFPNHCQKRSLHVTISSMNFDNFRRRFERNSTTFGSSSPLLFEHPWSLHRVDTILRRCRDPTHAHPYLLVTHFPSSSSAAPCYRPHIFSLIYSPLLWYICSRNESGCFIGDS